MLGMSEREVFDAQRGMFRQVVAAHTDAVARSSMALHPVGALIARASRLYDVTRSAIVRSPRRCGAALLAIRWICYRVVTEGRVSAADASRRLGLQAHGCVFRHAWAHAVTCGLPAPRCHRSASIDALSYVRPEPCEVIA